uniref:Reverse transcriptase Ty1/copia-type domain-containing protein n=1 Tax=Solanum lycopersicum TaxID=4081 RepID=A0A3Q7GJT8_SOLLC
MKISRDRSASTLNLSQKLYFEKVRSRFRVNDAKPRTTPLANHFKLSKEQSPKAAKERDHMALVPYASAVCSLMYAMKVGLEKCTSQPTPMTVFSSTNGADTPFDDITHFRSLIGALRYLAITRPDIQFAVNRVAQSMHQPSEHDYHCLKRILRYIFGTLGRGLLIRPRDLKLRGFSDSDWANDKTEYRGLALLAAKTIG